MRHGSIQQCSRCGQTNRVPWSRLGEPARCGSCHAELVAPAQPIDVDGENFEELLRSSPVPVLVDFWAPWCGPCRSFAPQLERVASRADGRFVVAKLDTERNPEIAARHGVRSIPTIAVYNRGHELARDSGARPAAAVEAFVEQVAFGGGRMAMGRM